MIVESILLGAALILTTALPVRAEETVSKASPADQKRLTPPSGSLVDAATTEIQLDAYFFSAKPETTPALMTEYLEELGKALQFQYDRIQKRGGRHYIIHPQPRSLKSGEVTPATVSFGENANYSIWIAEGKEGQEAVRLLLDSKFEPAAVFLLDAPEPHTLRFPGSTGKVVHYLFYKGGTRNMLLARPKDTRLQNVVVPDSQVMSLADPEFRKLIRDTQMLGIIEAFQTGGRQQESGIALPPVQFDEPKVFTEGGAKKEKKA